MAFHFADGRPRKPFSSPRRVVPNDTPWNRADGGCVCSCGHEYREHDQVEVADTWKDNPLVLWQLCDGTYVKL